MNSQIQVAKSQILQKKRKVRMKVKMGERVFDAANIIMILLLCFFTLYPFWYVLVLSLNTGKDAIIGPIWFWPREFTLDNYVYVFHNPLLKNAFIITSLRAAIGALIAVTVMMFAAYALSKRFLPGRKFMLFYLMIPLFIGGSLISNYLVIVKLGMLNNFLVYVIPGAFNFFFMVIIRTFIEQMPDGLEESATIDGASYFQVFYLVIIPLSKPIIAAMLFFSVVGYWLEFSTNLFYITDKNLFILQYVLYMIVNSNDTSAQMLQMMTASGTVPKHIGSELPTPLVLKMATLIIVTLPLLFIYPFFQRYFVKGLMVGAIKA